MFNHMQLQFLQLVSKGIFFFVLLCERLANLIRHLASLGLCLYVDSFDSTGHSI